MKHNYLLMIYILINIVAFHMGDNVYYLLTALSTVLIPIYLLLNNNKHKLVWLLLLYTLGNLIDEIFGLGCVRSVFEYIFAILSLILIACRLKK